MSTKPDRPGRMSGWYKTPDAWFLMAAVVLPLGWVLPLCRFAWVRVRSQREQK